MVSPKLSNIQNIVFDLDSTVWHWNVLVDGAKETINRLKDHGKNIYYFTNNSMLTRAEFAQKLTNFGISTGEKDILCSGHVAARTFYQKGIRKAFVIGEQGLLKELEHYEIEVSESAKHVLTGMDRNLTYWKIAKAYEIINRGGEHWVCGNSRNLHVGKKIIPGERCISESIRAVTGQDYEVLGKPSEYAKKVFTRYFKVFPENTMIIGDDLKTDIKFGNDLGMKTGLILGGHSKKEDLNGLQKEDLPTFVFTDIKRILLKVE